MLGRKALIYDLGTVKLADFGLSKTLPVNKHASVDLDSKFKLTGETGSYRFMAREVFVHEAYNNKVRTLFLHAFVQNVFIAIDTSLLLCSSSSLFLSCRHGAVECWTQGQGEASL